MENGHFSNPHPPNGHRPFCVTKVGMDVVPNSLVNGCKYSETRVWILQADFCENLNLKTVTQNWTEVTPLPPQRKRTNKAKRKCKSMSAGWGSITGPRTCEVNDLPLHQPVWWMRTREKWKSVITRQFNLIELLIFIDWYAKFGGRLSGNLKRILCRNKLQDKSQVTNTVKSIINSIKGNAIPTFVTQNGQWPWGRERGRAGGGWAMAVFRGRSGIFVLKLKNCGKLYEYPIYRRRR